MPEHGTTMSLATPHGGQEWRQLRHFIEDCSVTTNGLGTPQNALQAATKAMHDIHHYPAGDFEPAWSSLANFICGNKTSASYDYFKQRLVLGNGASELIDLCVRNVDTPSWRPGPFEAQYKEYETSAEASGKVKCDYKDRGAKLWCMVNPCNPTGDFMELDAICELIEKYAERQTTIIVDESMIVWRGPEWRKHSLTSKVEWISEMAKNDINIYVLHSWTKIWACPGLRIGSILAPSSALAQRIRGIQVPWSVNLLAIEFVRAVVEDDEYLATTWSWTTDVRKEMCDKISELHPSWTIKGVPWMSFIWIDTHNEEEATFYCNKCNELGVPIRNGRMGYGMPTCVRIAVRDASVHKHLFNALSAKP